MQNSRKEQQRSQDIVFVKILCLIHCPRLLSSSAVSLVLWKPRRDWDLELLLWIRGITKSLVGPANFRVVRIAYFAQSGYPEFLLWLFYLFIFNITSQQVLNASSWILGSFAIFSKVFDNLFGTIIFVEVGIRAILGRNTVVWGKNASDDHKLVLSANFVIVIVK